MAKLDSLTRYPGFFEAVRAAVEHDSQSGPVDSAEAVEASMVQHHYGPWDKRYYQVLAHLEARRLITVSKLENSYQIALTTEGAEKAMALAKRPSFATLVERQKAVKKTFGGKSGTVLKT
ncbi:hypothetical protein [Pseudooceanicola nanhaiensis]|uniref:hypothetical protein n=1 Tax=Pseudooceanicola nanhaiensis TaxID=375761 RepID=UPI00405970D1